MHWGDTKKCHPDVYYTEYGRTSAYFIVVTTYLRCHGQNSSYSKGSTEEEMTGRTALKHRSIILYGKFQMSES